MEFPHIGNHCAEVTCNKLDFLPVKCDGCQQLFCVNHMSYTNHNCPTPKRLDNQVPVCPLCNTPIPGNRGQPPDIFVNAHIERDCQSDPAKSRRKTFIKCTFKGCKNKEVIPIICDKCSSSYCVFHRHPTDHKCTNKPKIVNRNDNRSNSSISNGDISKIQGNMSEDEALAYALALSMSNSSESDAYRTSRSNTANNNCALS